MNKDWRKTERCDARPKRCPHTPTPEYMKDAEALFAKANADGMKECTRTAGK